MPTRAYTNNTTNANGGVVDAIVAGCEDVFIDEELPGVNQYGESNFSAGSAALAVKNLLFWFAPAIKRFLERHYELGYAFVNR